MNPRDQQTLKAIFAEPVPVIEWESIEDLLISIGCRVAGETEDRVSFIKNDLIGSFPRPAVNGPTLDYHVRAVREYLVRLEIEP